MDTIHAHCFGTNPWYRTTAVLFDEKESDQKYKQRVAYVVSHELAHQWFGNLVTMDWWNEVGHISTFSFKDND